LIATTLTSARILRAGSWTALTYGFTQLTRLATSLIVTRLLVPEVFGIMAAAMVVATGLNLLTDLGLLQCMVRSPRADRRFLDTLWVAQIVRGAAIFAASLAIAGVLASLQAFGWIGSGSTYGNPILPLVVASIGLAAVLSGLESTKVAVARRELLLARLSQLEILCNVVSVAVVVTWARIDPSIRALVGGWLVGAALRTLLTHTMLPGAPNRLHWDPAAFRELLGFGKWVLVSSTLGFFAMNGDRLLLGGLVSAHDLGLYSIAFLILSAPRQGLSLLASSVAYPALSEVVRTRPAQLAAVYYRARLPMDLCSLGLAGFLFAAGDGLIRLLYDSRYAGAGPMLALLSLTLVFSRYEMTEQTFLALGKPRLLAIINTFRLVGLYALVPAGYALGGMHGALWGLVGAGLVPLAPTLYFASRHGLLWVSRELWHLLPLPAGFVLGEALTTMPGFAR
jgi:O-antigen/teichoic acid export membrane protein